MLNEANYLFICDFNNYLLYRFIYIYINIYNIYLFYGSERNTFLKVFIFINISAKGDKALIVIQSLPCKSPNRSYHFSSHFKYDVALSIKSDVRVIIIVRILVKSQSLDKNARVCVTCNYFCRRKYTVSLFLSSFFFVSLVAALLRFSMSILMIFFFLLREFT